MGIDYGTKRIGLAVTDPLQIIVSPLETVPTPQIFTFLKTYFSTEEIEIIVVGEPKKLDDSDAQILPQVRAFVRKLEVEFPNVRIEWQDERFTSKEAQRIILASGIPKMKRRDKSLVDKISAAIIVEDWMKTTGRWQH